MQAAHGETKKKVRRGGCREQHSLTPSMGFAPLEGVCPIMERALARTEEVSSYANRKSPPIAGTHAIPRSSTGDIGLPDRWYFALGPPPSGFGFRDSCRREFALATMHKGQPWFFTCTLIITPPSGRRTTLKDQCDTDIPLLAKMSSAGEAQSLQRFNPASSLAQIGRPQ